MPSYFHACTAPECLYEWEDFYSITKDPPKVCPQCNQETAKRLIAYATPGKVELSGRELTTSIQADANKMKHEMKTNENMYANMLGEGKYQTMQSSYDKSRRK